MKTVLVPIANDDYSDDLINYIKLYIPTGKYKIHLVHIYTSFAASEAAEINGNPKQSEKFLEEARLQDYEQQLKAAGYPTELSFLNGLVEHKFVELANAINPTFILMATSGSNNFLENIIGTGAYSIFEKTHAPVFFIPKSCNVKKVENAVVALHLEHETTEVLNEYFQYADNRGLKSEFLNIDDSSDMNIVDDDAVLAQFKSRYPGRINEVKYKRYTNVPKGILEFAKQSDADLIVLYTEEKNFIEKIFHVSVTRNLILHSEKPLLVFRY